jgi:hypothetical protein
VRTLALTLPRNRAFGPVIFCIGDGVFVPGIVLPPDADDNSIVKRQNGMSSASGASGGVGDAGTAGWFASAN